MMFERIVQFCSQLEFLKTGNTPNLTPSGIINLTRQVFLQNRDFKYKFFNLWQKYEILILFLFGNISHRIPYD